MVASASFAQSRIGRGPSWPSLLTIAVLVFGAVCAGLWISEVLARITAIWLANAILVFFLLKHDRRDWPAILAAGLFANLCGDLAMADDLFSSCYLTFCNAVGVLIVAVPLGHFSLQDDFSRPKPLFVFYALALGPAPAIAGLLSAVYFHYWIGRDYLTSALDWYATDALCYSIIVPVLMTVPGNALKRMFGRDEIVSTCAMEVQRSSIPPTTVLVRMGRAYPSLF